jgi:competence protein ComEC
MAVLLTREDAAPAPWRAAMAAWLARERDRLVLWLPVAQGLGVGGYFLRDTEPELWPAAALVLFGVIAIWLARYRPLALAIAAAGTAAAIGFAIASWRTSQVAAPILSWRTGPVEVSGRVVELAGARLTLDRLDIAGLAAADTPERVRVTLRPGGDTVRPGDRVRLRAMLQPPSGPPMPGAHDFARDAFFRRLGGVGFAIAPVRVIGQAEPAGFDIWLARLRRAVTDRIQKPLDPVAGPVAAAMITGERGTIPAWVDEVMRDSGIYHLLSISGVHFSIVAAVIFFGVRRLLALSETIALRHPIKKWAAGIAIAVSFGYLLLSGNGVPAQRSFLMIAVVLLAVLIDRSALSMRTVALAAAVVLALAPEALLGPSFQMSFAAVIALIAAYEAFGPRFAEWTAEAGPVRKAALYLVSIGLTTVVAGMASAPFALFHFGRFVNYGLIANLIAVPLTTLWIMPWSVLAMLLMPLGLESLALVPLGWGVHAMLAIAKWVAAWRPGAVLVLPVLPLWGLLAVVAGGLWLCLWRGPPRFLGVVGMALGLLSPATVDPPDLIVDEGGKLIAARAADGALMLRATPQRKRETASWLRQDGHSAALPWPEPGHTSVDGRLACDEAGCLYRANGRLVSILSDPEGIPRACRTSDVMISAEPARGRCRGKAKRIDRFDVWRHGTHAIWLSPERVLIRTVAEQRGDRPWSPAKRPRPKEAIDRPVP